MLQIYGLEQTRSCTRAGVGSIHMVRTLPVNSTSGVSPSKTSSLWRLEMDPQMELGWVRDDYVKIWRPNMAFSGGPP